jgi:hypothetical protein
MFHTDHSFLEVPGCATLLLPVAMPAAGRGAGLETDFCCLAAARRALPPGLAAGIAGRTALHGYGPGLLDAWMSENMGELPPTGPAPGTSPRRSWVRHPLDWAHPVTGALTIWSPFGTLVEVWANRGRLESLFSYFLILLVILHRKCAGSCGNGFNIYA